MMTSAPSLPRARNAEQARGNAEAANYSVSAEFLAAVRELYDVELREQIHPRW
ncbi:hypothetical protein [Glutamicibacter sp. X7]